MQETRSEPKRSGTWNGEGGTHDGGRRARRIFNHSMIQSFNHSLTHSINSPCVLRAHAFVVGLQLSVR